MLKLVENGDMYDHMGIIKSRNINGESLPTRHKFTEVVQARGVTDTYPGSKHDFEHKVEGQKVLYHCDVGNFNTGLFTAVERVDEHDQRRYRGIGNPVYKTGDE